MTVLERLRVIGSVADLRAKEQMAAARAGRDDAPSPAERAELSRDAPLAIKPEVGRLLYLLALGRRPGVIVEFGGSLGVSTIHLAAALRDGGGGTLITTEIQREKAAAAQRNLADAGLADLVELRVGDALETLADISAPVDLLFLDGWNELYLPVLHLMERHLAPCALVAADMSTGDPDSQRYRDYVADPRSGYASLEVPLDAGVLLSVRLDTHETRI
jgi:predicted O-methyltransferase YrrM